MCVLGGGGGGCWLRILTWKQFPTHFPLPLSLLCSPPPPPHTHTCGLPLFSLHLPPFFLLLLPFRPTPALPPLLHSFHFSSLFSLSPSLLHPSLSPLPRSSPQDHLTALMEVNEENQQLTKQYQREKQKRKEIEDVSGGLAVWLCVHVHMYLHCYACDVTDILSTVDMIK